MSPLEVEKPPQSEPLPTIGKVTMIYGNRSIYERGLKTHQEHGRRFGYPVSVLRKPVMSGTYSKCAILLSEMLRELEKPSDERLQWLL